MPFPIQEAISSTRNGHAKTLFQKMIGAWNLPGDNGRGVLLKLLGHIDSGSMHILNDVA